MSGEVSAGVPSGRGRPSAFTATVQRFLIAAIGFLVVAYLAGPVWQMGDDPYYAMLADGHGMVDAPVAAVPYLHPFVGQLLAGLRSLGASHSYALLLTLLTLLAAGVIVFRLAELDIGLTRWLACALALLPVSLSMQYTAVSGMLIAAAAVLIHRREGGREDVWRWMLAAVLSWFAAMLRVEMAVAAVFCLVLPLFIRVCRSKQSLKAWLVGFTLSLVGVVLAYWVAGWLTAGNRLPEFYRLNDPMAKLMNYGYIQALLFSPSALPAGFTVADIELFSRWFFAESRLIDPANVSALIDATDPGVLGKVRYWILKSYLLDLHRSLWPWVFLSSLALLLPLRRPWVSWLGMVLFLGFFMLNTVLQKPLPDRVAVGMVLGLFLISLMEHAVEYKRADPTWGRQAIHLSLVLLLPLAALACQVRHQQSETRAAWEQERPALLEFTKGAPVYAFAGKLPLSALAPPWGQRLGLADITFLGSMYLTPEVLDKERARACGGMVACLASGGEVVVLATEPEINHLSTYFLQAHARRLVPQRVLNGKTISAFVLASVPA